ncbi:hypothetical protein BH24ACT5_BH24ACT5_28350 [soil metagenome]
MRYEGVKELSPEAFKRLTGVRPEVFSKMIGVLRGAETEKKKAGRPSKLCLEDKLLLTLSYWREYRTQFHLAASYAIHMAAPLGAGLVTPMLSRAPTASLPTLRTY